MIKRTFLTVGMLVVFVLGSTSFAAPVVSQSTFVVLPIAHQKMDHQADVLQLALRMLFMHDMNLSAVDPDFTALEKQIPGIGNDVSLAKLEELSKKLKVDYIIHGKISKSSDYSALLKVYSVAEKKTIFSETLTLSAITDIAQTFLDIRKPLKQAKAQMPTAGSLAIASPKIAAGRKPGERKVLSVEGIEVALRWCPPGSMTMGSPSSEKGRKKDETKHEVTFKKGFWIMETEVNQLLFETLMEYNPSQTFGDDHPAEQISWDNAIRFCVKLSELTGKSFDLPTEAEWEYACRAGTQSAYSFGDSADKLAEYAWFRGNSDDMLHPVAAKQANPWGLFDMHGNVGEWCLDWYTAYPTKAVENAMAVGRGESHVFRGGSTGHFPDICRSASRSSHAILMRDFGFGIRAVLRER